VQGREFHFSLELFQLAYEEDL